MLILGGIIMAIVGVLMLCFPEGGVYAHRKLEELFPR